MAQEQGTTNEGGTEGGTGQLESGADRPVGDFRKLERALDDLMQALSDDELDTDYCQPKPVVDAMSRAEMALTETTGISLEERVAARIKAGKGAS